jgi:hypothetical protein
MQLPCADTRQRRQNQQISSEEGRHLQSLGNLPLSQQLQAELEIRPFAEQTCHNPLRHFWTINMS